VTPRASTKLARALETVRERCDVDARRAADPVGAVHALRHAEDQEVFGLVAACIAFGNVTTIRAKLGELVERIGRRPARAADDPKGLSARLAGWKHRVFIGDDVARLLVGARRVQRESGSLGERFARELSGAEGVRVPGAGAGDLRVALAAWCEAIRDAGGLHPGGARRGPAHLLPDPRGASGCKRLLLYLRWMVRPADGVDLGLWQSVDPALLLCPVDVHIHKLARNLGLTARRDLSWRTTEEITRGLAAFDPKDPAKYDFALCHMGMLQRCPSKRDASRCEGCAVKPVCIHWQGGRPRSPGAPA